MTRLASVVFRSNLVETADAVVFAGDLGFFCGSHSYHQRIIDVVGGTAFLNRTEHQKIKISIVNITKLEQVISVILVGCDKFAKKFFIFQNLSEKENFTVFTQERFTLL